MPSVRVNGVTLHYIEAGSGPETIVFSHGLIMDSESYREQVRALSARYRVVAYDHRGHGRSEVPTSGYDMETLAEDAAQLIEFLGAPVHFGGLSMGGFVGIRLAARRPELLRSLTLMATSADGLEGSNSTRRAIMAAGVRAFGFGPIAKRVVPFMYGKTYLGGSANYDWAIRYVSQLPRTLWRPMIAVMARPSVADELHKITTPTLVMVGDEDTLLPPSHSERLAAGIRNATFIRVPHTGHLITDENPAFASAAIGEFLASLSSDDQPLSQTREQFEPFTQRPTESQAQSQTSATDAAPPTAAIESGDAFAPGNCLVSQTAEQRFTRDSQTNEEIER